MNINVIFLMQNKNSFKERLVPGFAVEVEVFFKPEEYKYYNDAIRIMSEVSNFWF